MTGQLKWLLDPNAANTVDDKSDKAPFKACFAKPFMGTQLTVHVDRVAMVFLARLLRLSTGSMYRFTVRVRARARLS